MEAPTWVQVRTPRAPWRIEGSVLPASLGNVLRFLQNLLPDQNNVWCRCKCKQREMSLIIKECKRIQFQNHILYIYSYGNMTWHYMTWRYLKHSVQTKSVWMSNSDEVQQSNPRAQRTTEIAILNPEEKAAKSQSNPFLAEQAVEGQQKNWSQCRMVSFDWFLLIFNPPSSLHYKHLQTLQHLGPNTSRRSFLESDL